MCEQAGHEGIRDCNPPQVSPISYAFSYHEVATNPKWWRLCGLACLDLSNPPGSWHPPYSTSLLPGSLHSPSGPCLLDLIFSRPDIAEEAWQVIEE